MTRIIRPNPPARSTAPATAAVALPGSDAPGAVRPAASPVPAASSIARRSAAALCSVSSNSRSGTDPATIPAPVWTWAWPSRRTALRIVIAVSRLPS